MESSVPLQLAETIQTASINHAPSPTHDINPSTAASASEPVKVRPETAEDGHSVDSDLYEELDEDNEEDEDIPYSVIRSIPRKHTLPPLPDLRFEQSYLASIKDAKSNGRIAFITIRDQVVIPLLQGTIWQLALMGWRHWNATAVYSGSSVGARVRRWWWDVNNWTIPKVKAKMRDSELAGKAADVSASFLKVYWREYVRRGWWDM